MVLGRLMLVRRLLRNGLMIVQRRVPILRGLTAVVLVLGRRGLVLLRSAVVVRWRLRGRRLLGLLAVLVWVILRQRRRSRGECGGGDQAKAAVHCVPLA